MDIKKLMKDVAMVTAVGAVVGMSAAHAAVDAAVGTAITAGVTDVLAVIALGGVALLTIKGAGVVWRVAAKFVSKLGS